MGAARDSRRPASEECSGSDRRLFGRAKAVVDKNASASKSSKEERTAGLLAR